MATITCIVPWCEVITSRTDGLCETCWRARQTVETSLGAATFHKIVIACERDWALMNRIDFDQLRRPPRTSSRKR
jgi:hypothetical protein